MEQREIRSRRAHPAGSNLRPGDAVEVLNRFDGAWHRGFEIAAVERNPFGPSYRLRRCSDGSVLPTTFPAGAIEACA